MHYDIFNLLLLGLASVLAGVVVLLGMVQAELGPAARLNRHRQLLLAMALGTGMLAFAVKLIIIISFAGLAVPSNEESVLKPGVTGGSKSHPPGQTRYLWTQLPPSRREPLSTAEAASSGYLWQALPTEAPAPAGNPTTPQKIALGKQLFSDPILSRDGTLSCASCHDLFNRAGTDARQTASGIGGQRGSRNTPTIWNAAFQSVLFWDGRSASLEDQAKGPLLNPIEMGMPSLSAVEARVKSEPHYRKAFAEVFGSERPITIEWILAAIAAYERTLITPDTPYDRFVRGDLEAMTPQQIRGMALFESIGCVSCHHGPNFSAASLFDDRTPYRIFPAYPTPYERDYELLEKQGETGLTTRSVWRVPSLRNVALTGPWLHNGSISELEEVVRIMAATQLGWSGHYLLWSEETGTLREIDHPELSDQQVQEIVAFLYALSSDRLLERKNAHREDRKRAGSLAEKTETDATQESLYADQGG